MKFIRLFFLLALFTNLESETVNTGHAEVSLVKFSSTSASSKNLIGIKMDMQKNWHTYWKNPGDSGGPIMLPQLSSDGQLTTWYIYGIVLGGIPDICGSRQHPTQ